MRVMICEPSAIGHQLTYVRLLARALAPLPVTVVLSTTAQALATAPFEHQIQPLLPGLTVEAQTAAIRGGTLASARDRVRHLRHAVRATQPDHVLIPYADGLAQLLGLARGLGRGGFGKGVRLEGLMMRGGFAYPLGSALAQRVAGWRFQLALRAPIAPLHLIDPLPYDQLVQRRPRDQRLSLIPDPVEPVPPLPRAAARAALGLPVEGRLVACSGFQDERKGVDLLIRAFLAADLAPADRLLLAGVCSPVVRALLDGPAAAAVRAGRLIALDRYLRDDELAWVNCAADLVATLYPRHIGSASIVIRAAAAQRPVLGTQYGWIGHVIQRFGLGWTTATEDVNAVAAALAGALSRSADWSPSAAGRRFVHFHRVENFNAHWTAALRQRLGLPPAPELTPWHTVVGAA